MQRRWLVLLSLAQRAYSLVPPVKLTDLVVEVDFWTHFSDCFTRDDDPTKGVKERDVLYSAILADAINLGLLQMAQVTPGMSLNQLAWMSDYYLREETYQKALSEIVNLGRQALLASCHAGHEASNACNPMLRDGLVPRDIQYGKRRTWTCGNILTSRIATISCVIPSAWPNSMTCSR